jgi:TonB family protein
MVVVDRSTRNKALNDYALLTRDSIQRAWKTPLELNEPSAVKGRVRINYTIDNRGNLVSVKLIQGSGNPEMDMSLMNAIRAAAPFPYFPDGMEAENVLVRANFIVANTPAVPVTTVSHPITTAGKRDSNSKKFHWGAAAGASKSAPKPDSAGKLGSPPEEVKGSSTGDIPPRVNSKKYKWGASNN